MTYYDLERKVTLLPRGEARPPFSLQEVDAEGKPIGPEVIPWALSLSFHATSCLLVSSVDIKKETPFNASDEEIVAIAHTDSYEKHIICTLKPGYEENAQSWRQRYHDFSFFGTDRIISDIKLKIYANRKEDSGQLCRIFGSPADLPDEDEIDPFDMADFIEIFLYVRPELFSQLSTRISLGDVTDIQFRLSGAYGFYAEWTPSIHARHVKVLANATVHAVEGLTDESAVRRLGHVPEASLTFGRRIVLVPEIKKDEDDADLDMAMPSGPAAHTTDYSLQTLVAIQSLNKTLRYALAGVVALFVSFVFL